VTTPIVPFSDDIRQGDNQSPGDAVEETFSVGDLAEEFGISYRTIRHYEDEGLLRPMRQGMARLYSPRDRRRLMLILRGKRLGFSVAEIREFLDLHIVDSNQVEQMRFLLRRARERRKVLLAQREGIDAILLELETLEQEALAHLAAQGVAPYHD